MSYVKHHNFYLRCIACVKLKTFIRTYPVYECLRNKDFTHLAEKNVFLYDIGVIHGELHGCP